jgi:hypothetical protein
LSRKRRLSFISCFILSSILFICCSLCVFNDACFSTKDLEKIQQLGKGSKMNDPSKTGQFGVGFNAVYHLTDAPSFLTRGKSTPNGFPNLVKKKKTFFHFMFHSI